MFEFFDSPERVGWFDEECQWLFALPEKMLASPHPDITVEQIEWNGRRREHEHWQRMYCGA